MKRQSHIHNIGALGTALDNGHGHRAKNEHAARSDGSASALLVTLASAAASAGLLSTTA